MSTHAIEGTRVLNDTSIVAARQASDPKVELNRKLVGLLAATMDEKWLPMGFRTLVVQEFPAMRRLVKRGGSANEKLQSYVDHLLAEAEPYESFAKRSAAFQALRDLHADLRSMGLAA